MNRVLPDRWLERIQRLALGLEPVDAARAARVRSGVVVAVEDVPHPMVRLAALEPGEDVGDVLPAMDRHPSSHYVLLHGRSVSVPVTVRLFDRRRTFVPRRLLIDVPSEATVSAPETNAALVPVPLWRRVLRPRLFPGAAYDVTSTATGLRGRVLRAGDPMRWARVVATLAGTNEVVGRAHGDDRGEFLLLLNFEPRPNRIWNPSDPLPVAIDVWGPDPRPTPPAAEPSLPRVDPLWDLPIEEPQIRPPGTRDPVEDGTEPPGGYRATAGGPVDVKLPLGRISSSAIAPFTFT